MRLTLILLLLLVANNSANAAGYLLKQGKGYAICEAFKKQLDKLGSLKEPLSPFRLRPFIYEVSGVKEAAWQDLDVETHDDLFEKLIRYDMKPGNEMGEMRFKERLAQWRAEAKAGKAKLQVLRANLVLYDDAPETIVRISRKYGEGKHEYSVIMYPMTEDIKEIDLIKIRRTYWMPGGELMMYGSRLYVVGSDFLVSSDFGSGLVPFCTIDFDWKTFNKEMKK